MNTGILSAACDRAAIELERQMGGTGWSNSLKKVVSQIIFRTIASFFPTPAPVDDKALAEAIDNLLIKLVKTPFGLWSQEVNVVLTALRAAQQEVAELRKRDADDKELRRAFIRTIEPYGFDLINKTFGEGKTSAEHLRWMVTELLKNIDIFPADKISRWIGFVQGVMAANAMIDVDAERDRTRPFFQKAYDKARAAGEGSGAS